MSEKSINYAFYYSGRYLWYDDEWLFRFKNPHGFEIFPSDEAMKYDSYDHFQEDPGFGKNAEYVIRRIEEEISKQVPLKSGKQRIKKKVARASSTTGYR